MANREHVEIVVQGAEAIDEWRKDNPGKRFDLTGANLRNARLSHADLEEVNLAGANLRGAHLNGTDLTKAKLRGADLDGAILHDACLHGTDLIDANLSNAKLQFANLDGAKLQGAKLRNADLTNANLRNADLKDATLFSAELECTDLRGANLTNADLSACRLVDANLSDASFVGASLSKAFLARTIFGENNLADTEGLEDVVHFMPSLIGIKTLVASRGKIPDVFLQGCGFQPWQILDAKLYDPDLSSAEIADLQYDIFQARTSGPLLIGGVFISYSRTDAKFADKIRSTLMGKGVSVWLDRHDLVAGPLQKQIDRAVGLNNVVLLVLSKSSIESDWVEHEVKTARKIERKTKRDVLCPVSIDDTWKEKVNDVDWEHLTKKNILDFSKWKTKAFAAQFDKLLKGLKIYYEKPG